VAEQRDIPNTNEIVAYHHCAKCLEELPGGTSPQEYVRYQSGWTKLGLQVWCNRHNMNIMHIDFQGQQHPANMTGRLPDDT
jgi:hypothetical protein